jgi:hypothetical protein
MSGLLYPERLIVALIAGLTRFLEVLIGAFVH